MIRYTFLGTSDDHTTCECCGKSDLKSTVAIHDIDNGTDHFFGTTCAARALKIQVVEVRKGTAAADKIVRDAKQAAAREAAMAAFRAARAERQSVIDAMLRREAEERAERRRNGMMF